jgi:hypothetical protein
MKTENIGFQRLHRSITRQWLIILPPFALHANRAEIGEKEENRPDIG